MAELKRWLADTEAMWVAQLAVFKTRFEAVGEETRVTVEHRGWDEIPQDHVARHGFERMLFQRRQAEHWRVLLAAFEAKMPRI